MAGLGAVGKCARILTLPVCCEASEDWSSRRYMEPSVIEGLWERELLPAPEPTEGQVSRARARIVALSGLDEGAMAA